MNRFVGVDYHKAVSFAVIMDSAGNILKRGRMASAPFDCEAGVQGLLGRWLMLASSRQKRPASAEAKH